MASSSSYVHADDDIGQHGLSYSHEVPLDQYTSFLPGGSSPKQQEKDVIFEVNSLRRPRSNTSISRPKRHMLILDWKYEIAASIISYAAMLALVFVLRAYGDFDETRWTWKDVSLNTIVSIIATVIRISCMFPVSVSLLQAGITNARRAARGRWSDQRLGDLEAFHNASRGAIGSVKMLFAVKP